MGFYGRNRNINGLSRRNNQKMVKQKERNEVRYLLYSDHEKENSLYIIKKSLFQKDTMETFEQFYQEKIKPRIIDLDD